MNENQHSIRISSVTTGLLETFAASPVFTPRIARICLRQDELCPGQAGGSRVPGSSERHTYVIGQDCGAVEDGHGVLLLIVVELFVNLEETRVNVSSPASKQ